MSRLSSGEFLSQSLQLIIGIDATDRYVFVNTTWVTISIVRNMQRERRK